VTPIGADSLTLPFGTVTEAGRNPAGIVVYFIEIGSITAFSGPKSVEKTLEGYGL
jgi:hypothetical protein